MAELGLDYELEYVIPEEGTNLWLDSWVIPAKMRTRENAEKWIDYMCRPDIAKRTLSTSPTPPQQGRFRYAGCGGSAEQGRVPGYQHFNRGETFKYLGGRCGDNLQRYVEGS